jgi:transposase
VPAVPGRAVWAGNRCRGLSRRVLVAETGPVSDRLRVREIGDDEGRRLVRINRRGSGSVVTWRRAQMVLLPAQGMDVPAIAKVAFTSEDRVRDVVRNFNADGFSSLYPKYRGGRPPKFTLGQRREINKVAKAKPAEYDLPFSTWSLAKLAEFLVAEGVVDDISHEGLRLLLHEEGVTFQRLKTWKGSRDPQYAAGGGEGGQVGYLQAAGRELLGELTQATEAAQCLAGEYADREARAEYAARLEREANAEPGHTAQAEASCEADIEL